MPLPEKDEMFLTKGKMLQDIIVSFGGRVAEELVFDDITTGASQDIKQATRLARDMVKKYGMSDNVGLICYGDDDDEVFIGRDLAHTRGYSEGVASVIDQEVKKIIDDAYTKAKEMITSYRSVLDKCAELLLEKEKISREELEAGREAVLSTLRATHDSPGSIENYYVTAALSGMNMTPAEYMAAVERVQLSDVVACAKSLCLHSTYFLKGATE